MKFIARPNTWFDKGTEAELLNYHGWCWNDLGEKVEWGLFRGKFINKVNEQVCHFDEFDITEE